MTGLTYGIIEGAELGYTSVPIIVAFAIAVAGAIVLGLSQTRGRHPMVPPSLFQVPGVLTAPLIAFATMAAFYGVVFLQSLYFQQLRCYGPLTTGLLFLPMTALVAALNPLVGRLMNRVGFVVPIIGGQVIMILGLVGLSLLPAYAPALLVAGVMVPVGVGGSFTVPPITAVLLDRAPASLTGTASGVLNTARQMGGSLGVAVFGAVIAQRRDFMTGLRLDLAIAAAVLLGLLILAARMRKHA